MRGKIVMYRKRVIDHKAIHPLYTVRMLASCLFVLEYLQLIRCMY